MNVINENAVKGGYTGEIQIEGGVTIHLFKTDTFASADWRPCKVTKNGVSLWDWVKGQTAPKGSWGELVEMENGLFIAIRNKFVLHEVVSMKELASRQAIMVAGKKVYIGGASLETKLNMKLALSNSLGIDPQFTMEEVSITNARNVAMREANKEKEIIKKSVFDEKAAKKQAKIAEQEAKRRSIKARNKVEAYGADGTKYWGIPVIGDEWMCLEDGAFVILTKEDGSPISAFKVVKQGAGNPRKGKVYDAFTENPLKEKVLEASRLIPRLTLKGVTQENIPVFSSIDDVRALRDMGLNSGTWVAVPSKDHEGRLTVHAVHHDRVDTIGVVEQKARVTQTPIS